MGVPFAAIHPLLACAACFGAPGHPATWGMNMAIGLMLIIVAGVLSGFLAFIRYLAKKARQAEALERAGAFDFEENVVE